MIIKQQNRKTITCMFMIISLSLILMNSCGGEKGNSSYTITALQGTGGAPIVGRSNCYPIVQFIVKDSGGSPVNGIQVELVSNGLLAEHTTGNTACQSALISTSNGIVTYTKKDGTVSTELISTPTASGQKGFINATSGAAKPALWETDTAVEP
ncbi:MAG: hypothetical protein WC539_04670 [Nitrospirota bacterium]